LELNAEKLMNINKLSYSTSLLYNFNIQMRYIFRSDASPVIGAGHVMRSSAIAEEFINAGHEVFFIGKIQGIKWLSERIQTLGFTQIIEDEENFLPNSFKDVLIIDSYFIDIDSNFIAKSRWLKIVSIFDEVSPKYFCDMRIHPGLSSNWDEIPGVKTLSGPKYVPIRKSLKTLANSIESDPLRILIVGGGTDINDFGLNLTRVLLNLKNEFHAVLIVDDENKVLLDSRFNQIKFGSNFDEIIAGFDLVFTTASTTSLELAAKGLAVGVGCSVKNQEIYYSKLHEMNLAVPIGKFNSNFWSFNLPVIIELIESRELRHKVRANALDALDFLGAHRIFDEIINLTI